MSTARIPVTYPEDPDRPTIPVRITNPANKKSITLQLLLDTGWDANRIDEKYGSQLGFSTSSTLAKASDYNIYLGLITIGNLKPITTYINVSIGNPGYNVFGALPMRQFDRFIISRSHVTATDSSTGAGTPDGLINAVKDWFKYTYVGGVPRLASATEKQAAFAYANSLPAWYRKRI